METETYAEFLASKNKRSVSYGFDADESIIHPMLFDFQKAIVAWAVKRGRAAIFADCGMGKTIMQIEWAKMLGKDTLVVAPLSVAQQTVREAAKIGAEVRYVREDGDPTGIRITNYEHVHKFDAGRIGSVILDESSILKNCAGKMRKRIIETFSEVPYRLACTATPSPNDHAELTNHSEFLGVASRVEVLANFFVHDESIWRLKGHAHTAFYDWVATWAVSCRYPSDLGFDDDGFILPPLSIEPVVIESPQADGLLFGSELAGVQGRSKERRQTLKLRIEAAARKINECKGQVIAWCGLNDESSKLHAILNGQSVEITGSDSPESKEDALISFQQGRVRVLVTKPSICGFGLNLQNAHSMVFVGLSDSYEKYYQAIRRCFRFGQTDPVRVYVVHSEAEGAIVENIRRKERDAMELGEELVKRCAAVSDVVKGQSSEDKPYMQPTQEVASGRGWSVTHDDCIAAMERMDAESIDFSVFSPPFASLYTYSDSPHDMGNTSTFEEFEEHFKYFPSRLLQLMKPGRIVAVHCAQITATNTMDGYIGIKDFRGLCIRSFKDAGFIHHGEVTVDKCPQAQAIRTKSKSLLFVQKERDSSWLRPALADYVVLFRTPGLNAVPIQNDAVSREDWIEWARPVWYGIRESDTLNAKVARTEQDERHVCPLQLDLIHRCIMLWSNVGETVFSPFAGIGSEGYVAIEDDRDFKGIELKREYFEAACRNLRTADEKKDQLTLPMEDAV